jgi:hypothetical protein
MFVKIEYREPEQIQESEIDTTLTDFEKGVEKVFREHWRQVGMVERGDTENYLTAERIWQAMGGTGKPDAEAIDKAAMRMTNIEVSGAGLWGKLLPFEKITIGDKVHYRVLEPYREEQ